MIDLNNIIVEFESDRGIIRAVDDVSVHVDSRDIYGIVGFSGAGKSTLVRTVNLLQRPTSGEVVFNGVNLEQLPQKDMLKVRKKIGMIFQHYNLMESRTVYENVAYPLRKSSLSKIEKRTKVLELLDFVGIDDKVNNYPSQLSGGQKQRVAIARALANDPEILLCDEATSALDPRTTSSILKLLKKLNKELNLTILLITHDMQVIKDICNKVAIMERGKIVESGHIVDVFSNPQTELTRDFISKAGNAEESLEKIVAYLDKDGLKKDERLVKLSYLGDSATEPLIIYLYDKFNVKTNVLYGNIEFLGDIPFGNLVVILEGEDENLHQAFNFIRESGTKVDEFKPGGEDIGIL